MGFLINFKSLTIGVILWTWIDQPTPKTFSPIDWGYLVLLGVITTAGAHTLLVASLKKLDAKTVAMIGCLQPVLATFLAWSLLGESISLYVLVGGSFILMVALYESIHQ